MQTRILPALLLVLTTGSTLFAQVHTWSSSSSSSFSSSSGSPQGGSSRFPIQDFSQQMQLSGFGAGFGGTAARAVPFAVGGSTFTASYHNTPAIEVVGQLAGMAQLDPQLTESSLEKLKSAEPITQQFRNRTPREALDEVLKSLDLSLLEAGDKLVLNAGREGSRSRRVLDMTLRSLGLDAQLQRPFPLMAFQTPLGMFLQSASMQLGVEIEVDYQKLRISPQAPVSIQPFTAETLGESLQAGLASAGLEYRVTGGKLVIGHRAD